MSFQEINLQESTLIDLYDSAVAAFPTTIKRQYATDTIRFTKMQWTPFLGLKTLYVRGLAQNEGREYQSSVVFKGVRYHLENNAQGLVSLETEGKKYLLERLNLNKTEVLVRCQCGDFRWRGIWANYLDHSLQGPNRKKYEALYRPGSANPTNSPMLCKHLIKMGKVLKEAGIFSI